MENKRRGSRYAAVEEREGGVSGGLKAVDYSYFYHTSNS
jgi:hypothetical protein